MDPHRLGRAEQIIQQFILNKLPEDRYALVGFNYNGVILSFLTRDPQGLLPYFEYLNRTTNPGIGTNMGAAMLAALRVFDAHEQIVPADKDRRRVLVLLSDGDDTVGAVGRPDTRRRRTGSSSSTPSGSGPPAAPCSPCGGRHRATCWSTRSPGPDSVCGRLRRRRRCARSRTEPARASTVVRTTARFRPAINEILVAGRPIAGYQSYPARQDLYFHFFVAAFVCMLAATFL